MLRNLKKFIVVHFLLVSLAYADTPAPGAVYIKGGTTNTLIGNVGDSSKVNVTNTIAATVSGNVPVTQATSPWVTSVNNFPATQAVTQGTSPWVTSGNLGRTWTLNSGTDSVSFAGTVTATNPSVGLNAATLPTSSTLVGAQLGANLQPLQLNASKYLYVDGSQVTQPVSGTVAVSNFPGTQVVSGTVTANAGSGNFTVIQPSGASLHTDVDNFPSSQNVVVTNSPTVAATQSGGWTTGRTWTLNSASDSVMIGNSVINVSQSTNPWTVAGTVTANAGSGTFQVGQITGTNLHTVVDNFPSTFGVTQGTSPWLTSRNWTLSGGTDSVNISNFPATQSVTQGTTPWVVGGTVTANAGTGTFQTNVTNSSIPVTQSGTWTNTVTQPTAANLNATVVQGTSPWVTNATLTGGSTTANQGTPAVTANAWPTKVTDGTNTAAVKPAATAPTVGDPSLVVAISPNSPISVTSVPATNTVVTGTITSACPTGAGCAPSSYVMVGADGFTSLGFETHGTWSATLTQDISYDPLCSSSPGTALWYQTAAFDTDADSLIYVTSWGSGLNNDPWVMPIAGTQCVRVRASAYTSGTVDVTLNSGVGASSVYAAAVGNVASGSADIGNPVKVGGKYNLTPPTFSDGQRGDLQLDASGKLQTLDSRTWNLSSPGDSVAATQSGSWTVQQGGAPWSVSQSGAWTTGRTWTLSSGTDSVNVGNFPSTFGVTQSTSPWVVSGTVTANAGTGNFQVVQSLGSNLHVNIDSIPTTSVTQGSSPWVENVSQFGGNNVVTGTGVSGVGIPRVTVSNDSNILATQSGAWTTGRTWSLSSGSDSVSAVQSGTWTVQQGGAPWSVSQSGTWNINNVSGTISLPTGASTASNQTSGSQKTQVVNSSGTSVDAKTLGTQVVSTDVGLVTNSVLHGLTTAGGGSYVDVKVNPSGALSTSIGDISGVTGQATMANSFPVAIASNQSAIPVTQSTSPWVDNISQFGGSNVVTGTGASGAGIPRVTVSNDSNVLATQSGTWNINNISGTVSLPTGAATAANQTNGAQKTQLVDGAGAVVGPVQTISGTNYAPVVLAASATSGSALVARSIQVAGSDGTNAQTLSTDTTGKLNINNISGTVSLPTGAATASNQTSQITQETTTATNTTSILANQTNGTQITKVSLLPSDIAPATQNVTVQDTASTSTTYANGQVFVTGTPTANSAASFTVSSLEAISVQVTGTWTGTLATEISFDGGTTWMARGVKQNGSSYIANSFTNNFAGDMNGATITNVRIRATAAMTGTATVKVVQSIHPASIVVSNPQMLRDGTTQSITNTIKAASTAAVATDTSQVVALSPNTPLPAGSNLLGSINQGTSPWVDNVSQFGGSNVVTGTGASGAGIPRVTVSNDSNVLATQSGTWTVQQGATPTAVANAWPIKLTDGTNTTAVKAASTAAGATDPSAVVALSPNSPLPTGTNSIGAVTQATASNFNAQVVGSVASGASDSGNPEKIGGIYESTQTSVSTGQRANAHTTAFGDLTTGNNTKFAYINTAATTTVKSGAGLLYAICINKPVNAETVSIFDNTAGSGTTIGVITQSVGGGVYAPVGCMRYDGMVFSTGLTLVTSSTSDITVLYK